MIHLYRYNKSENILGFNFYLFKNKEWVTDHDVYKDTVDMDRYFESSKCDIIGINLERFITFCSENTSAKTILIEEALTGLSKATAWRAKNEHRYNDFLKLVIRGESKMIDLVSSLDRKEKIYADMMRRVIVDFVKEEVE